MRTTVQCLSEHKMSRIWEERNQQTPEYVVFVYPATFGNPHLVFRPYSNRGDFVSLQLKYPQQIVWLKTSFNLV